ncbi:MAG: ribosome-binding factor A [Chlamydiae bacterium RIFCSPHIGHO2_12_FULL_27_8]|nr:MAG: ribosome-binding factor A [Chlamydiae bacterium RIFCSPHIGHO2_12_FULL_27_8]
MKGQRIKKLNSLLREVISEVIAKDVSNPHISKFISISSVDVTADLSLAKVYVSIIGNDEEKEKTIAALNRAAGFIGVQSAKKVVLRYFPHLLFKLDDSVDKHMKIEKILSDIENAKSKRQIADE